ncbi:MAG: hypothetical protein ACUVSX_06770 [Aggregatilineales bacterium]
MKLSQLLTGGGVLLIAVGLAVGVAAQDAPPNPLGDPPTFLRDIYDDWVASPHAKVEATAFNFWNNDGQIPANCAACHSTYGYLDFMGEDGSAFGVVDNPAPVGSVINCDACHNQTASELRAVSFPSGVTLDDLGDSARCMVCHQGLNSGLSVTAALETAGLTGDLDTVSADLRFVNIHYYPAAASLYGGEVNGGFQFDGKRYQRRNDHVEGYQTCGECHNPHTLEVKLAECAVCHEGVETVADLRAIRMQGSMADYDGDGDMDEGIAGELETLQEMLYEAITLYAAEVAGTPILYSAGRYPYFFADLNANGQVDEGEGAYNAFTGRLLQAVYNYQMSQKDPGGYAHNPKYYVELLYDSIESLNSGLAQGVDLTAARRDDPGHFDASALSFRFWDAQGEVPAACTKCHTAEGLPFFVKNNVNIAAPPSNSLACATCHSSVSEFTLYELNEVTFPSGARVSFGEGDPNNVCLNCHQGRESTVSVDQAIANAGVGDDEVSEALNFRNPHYFASGATLFGADAQGAYQFAGKAYSGRNYHARNMETCTDCHDVHMLEVEYDLCGDCHENVRTPADMRLIRMGEDDDVEPVDYDGDGSVDEPIRDEILALHETLLDYIMDYAANTLGAPVVYAPYAFPYWFNDTNGNGVADPDEVNSGNRFATWSPNMLRAAYNYQFTAKAPGAYTHNPSYILQVLYDSIEALGGPEAVATFTRAPVRVND